MRKICTVIGSRANYSSIKSAMRAIQQHPDLQLQVIAAASALLDRYGQVVRLIEQDGFEINERLHILIEGETPATMAKSTGVGLIELVSSQHQQQDLFCPQQSARNQKLMAVCRSDQHTAAARGVPGQRWHRSAVEDEMAQVLSCAHAAVGFLADGLELTIYFWIGDPEEGPVNACPTSISPCCARSTRWVS